MKVRIHRVPPSRFLEGVDLGPERLQPGRLYELDPVIAGVLLVWGYAERVGPEPSADRDKQLT